MSCIFFPFGDLVDDGGGGEQQTKGVETCQIHNP